MTTEENEEAQFGAGDRHDRFLRLCLQGRWDPAAFEAARDLATRKDIDGPALLSAARSGGLGPLIYQATRGRELLPTAVEEELRQDYIQSAKRILRRLRDLEAALGRLAAEGLDVILLKGGALAEAVYGNVAVRPMCDFDLLVREEDVSPALRALSALGYALEPGLEQGDAFHVQDIHANEVMVRKPGPGAMDVIIEIHWQLFWFPYYRRVVPMDWFWETTLPLEVGGTAARMLGPEAQVLHLCGHLLHHHGSDGAFRPLWLYDVAAVIAHYRQRIDWDELLDRARAYRLVTPLQQILIQVSEVWRAPIPPSVLERLRAMRPSRDEERALAWLSATSGAMETYALAGLAGLPDWKQRLRFAWHDLLFPSVGFIERRYDVPHRLLVPLYYPYRWLLGLWGALGSRRRR